MKPNALSVSQANEMTPWDVADHYGIMYSGDLNPVPHDGTFYAVDEWGDCYGVRIISIEDDGGILWVESGVFIVPDSFDPATDLIDEYTFECDQDFSGDYRVEFRGDELGDFDEDKVWAVVLPWLSCLAESAS